MFRVCKLLARDYPNGVLITVGLALVILPELHARSVFYLYVGIHHKSWTLQPFLAEIVDLWWAAEHTTQFMAVAISVTVIGAIMALVGTFRWLRHSLQKKK